MKTIYLGKEELILEKEELTNKIKEISKSIRKETFYDMTRYNKIDDVIEILKDDYHDLEDDGYIGDIQIICGDNKKYHLSFKYDTYKIKMDRGPDIYKIDNITDIIYTEITK